MCHFNTVNQNAMYVRSVPPYRVLRYPNRQPTAHQVEVVNTNSGEAAVFPWHNWLDTKLGISQLLTPDRDGDGKGDELVGGPIVEYTVKTITSDLRYGGGLGR